MAAQICETCTYKDSKCYCSPNSTCEGYEREKILEDFLKAVETFDLHTTRIFFGYPLDLLTMDMSQISSDCIFISNSDVDRGKLLLIQDEELKEELYKFAKQHPDRVFKGELGGDAYGRVL